MVTVANFDFTGAVLAGKIFFIVDPIRYQFMQGKDIFLANSEPWRREWLVADIIIGLDQVANLGILFSGWFPGGLAYIGNNRGDLVFRCRVPFDRGGTELPA